MKNREYKTKWEKQKRDRERLLELKELRAKRKEIDKKEGKILDHIE